MRTLRWLAIVPGAYIAWYLVFVSGLFIHGIVEAALCPPDEMISGMCANGRVRAALDLLIHLFVGVSAVAVVSAAVAIAPSRKKIVAWLAFSTGSAAALILAMSVDASSNGVVAIVAGLAAACLFERFLEPESDSQAGSGGGSRVK